MSHSLPPGMKLGQGYVFTGMCDSVHGGVCLSASWVAPQGAGTPLGAGTPRAGIPLGADTPPGADTPQEQTPPPVQSMLGDTVNAQAVRILLECNLVYNCF